MHLIKWKRQDNNDDEVLLNTVVPSAQHVHMQSVITVAKLNLGEAYSVSAVSPGNQHDKEFFPLK